MMTEDQIADILSRLILLGEDLPDAKTKQQKTMWSIDAQAAMQTAFETINQLVVELAQAKEVK